MQNPKSKWMEQNYQFNLNNNKNVHCINRLIVLYIIQKMPN